jgi:hypothetical protein
MNDLDLLERSLTTLYIELKAMADMCEDESKKKYYLGRVSGVELAISLFGAWKRELDSIPDSSCQVAEVWSGYKVTSQ